jgi:hypothetical protein
MADALISSPNYLSILPNGDIMLVCYEMILSEQIIWKIANNYILTCADFPTSTDFYDGGIDIMRQFKIKKLIVMQDNLIRFYSVQQLLLKALKTNTTITYLDMSATMFGNKSIKLIEQIIMENTTLKTIVLSNCNLRTHHTFSTSLLVNTTLKVLKLEGNSMFFEDFSILMNTFKVNNTLKELNVGVLLGQSDKYSVERTAQHDTICEALSINTGLEEITFNIEDEMVEKIEEAFNINTTLKVINISIQFEEFDIDQAMHRFEPGLYGCWTQPSNYEDILIAYKARLDEENECKSITFKNMQEHIMERNRILPILKKMEVFVLAITRRQLFLPEDLLISACRYLC